ncbi:MAG: molybdopterin molybdotransferase MoeA [Pseudomonadota bacterium]
MSASGDPAARGLLSVEAAMARVLALASPAVGPETVSLSAAEGRLLRAPVIARRDQPPFDAAQMDGYVCAFDGEVAAAGARFALVGETRAGGARGQALRPGEAMRIFTGAPTPAAAPGASLGLALQEDAEVLESAAAVRFSEAVTARRWIRRAGLDFTSGQCLIEAGRRLRPEEIALAAAAGAPWLTVARRPRAVLLTLGDELRLPGEPIGAAEIFSSNQFGVAALLRRAGADVVTPPVAPDDLAALRGAIRAAAGADLIVTLGGASDGDHDLARPAFAAEGMDPTFYKIAMRPGKPLMAGRLGGALVIGLPGNPVSAMVCARLFLIPALRALEGAEATAPEWFEAPLAVDLGPGGARDHYMRAQLQHGGGGASVRPYEDQDSSRLALLASADCLARLPAGAPALPKGSMLSCLPLH